MKIIGFGKSGQVARSLAEQSGPDLTIHTMGRDDVDLGNDLGPQIAKHAPDALINAAAYTAVDAAETDQDAALALNCDAVRRMGDAAAALNIPIIHISTDYVFEGGGTAAWRPNDPTGPLGVYGATKLAGEHALAKTAARYAILRTSWVFSAHGNNFVKTMLRLGRDRDALNIVGDQIGGPTAAADIAQAAVKMAQKLAVDRSISGVWHYAGQEDCSWADFATEIFRQAKVTCAVTAIPTSEYPTPAKRPLNSRLDCTTTKTDFDISRPDWKDSLARVLKELGEPS